MGELFGTDGIRGRANTYPMTAEMAARIGHGAAVFFLVAVLPVNMLIERQSGTPGRAADVPEPVFVEVAGAWPGAGPVRFKGRHGRENVRRQFEQRRGEWKAVNEL